LQAVIGLVRTMRPKQWTKNLLFIFPGLIFDGQVFDPTAFARVFLAFVLFSFISGSVYIINDLVDIESDRRHPKKRSRPLPSGQLPVPVARVAAVALPLVTLAIALAFSLPLAAILAFYLVMQICYSFYLKNIVIVDVLTITIGFVLRVAAGVAVIEVENFSPWLYACAGFLALFLAIGKRRQELVTLGEDAPNVRRIFQYYNLPLIDEMMRVVTTGTLITYTLYTIESESTLLDVNGANVGLLTVPFVLYGLFRYLYLIHVLGETSPPDEVLLKDRPLQVDIALFGLMFIFILYILPHG
jgi:4-hydroxybenzoate polyprenyltransferase